MEAIPDNAFVSSSGKLGQLVKEEPESAAGVQLVFFVEIAFEKFEWQGQELAPILRVNGLNPEGVKQWRALERQRYEFPYAPKPGSLDAGIHLFQVQNPADVTALQFGAMDSTGKLPVQFEAEVDFEIEADMEWEQVELQIDCALEVASLKIATSIDKKCPGDESAIYEMLGDVIDTEAYESMVRVPGGLEMPIKL